MRKPPGRKGSKGQYWLLEKQKKNLLVVETFSYNSCTQNGQNSTERPKFWPKLYRTASLATLSAIGFKVDLHWERGQNECIPIHLQMTCIFCYTKGHDGFLLIIIIICWDYRKIRLFDYSVKYSGHLMPSSGYSCIPEKKYGTMLVPGWPVYSGKHPGPIRFKHLV